MDSRDFAAARGNWFSALDESRMAVKVEIAEADVWLRFTYVVCELCGGTGKHVDPGIDSHGLSREDFNEDPDFADAYFSGQYDVTCYECKGKRVVPELDDCAQAEAFWEQQAMHAQCIRDDQYEREMGY